MNPHEKDKQAAELYRDTIAGTWVKQHSKLALYEAFLTGCTHARSEAEAEIERMKRDKEIFIRFTNGEHNNLVALYDARGEEIAALKAGMERLRVAGSTLRGCLQAFLHFGKLNASQCDAVQKAVNQWDNAAPREALQPPEGE